MRRLYFFTKPFVMALPNIFTRNVADDMIRRINSLTPATSPKWGKMNVSQMLAHCNVTYELVFTDKHPKPGALMRFIIKLFAKNTVVSEKPYSHNSQTAPVFVVTDVKDFEKEKKRLIDHINQVQQLGEAYFEGKESHAFGPLTKEQWNNLFYKHLSHHLDQFGA